jgi:hypothetical protein
MTNICMIFVIVSSKEHLRTFANSRGVRFGGWVQFWPLSQRGHILPQSTFDSERGEKMPSVQLEQVPPSHTIVQSKSI